jgi:hypothetical protein
MKNVVISFIVCSALTLLCVYVLCTSSTDVQNQKILGYFVTGCSVVALLVGGVCMWKFTIKKAPYMHLKVISLDCLSLAIGEFILLSNYYEQNKGIDMGLTIGILAVMIIVDVLHVPFLTVNKFSVRNE